MRTAATTTTSGTLHEQKLIGLLSGRSVDAIQRFCDHLPKLPTTSYGKALLGMGYVYESFDLMFASIATAVQETHDDSDYVARYKTMQNVLRPFASEYGIEPDRPLQHPHRKLFADFYHIATGADWPPHYSDRENAWLACGRHWANVMLRNLRRPDLTHIQRAKYNLGYHWAVEFLSVSEFDRLKAGWRAIGIDAVYLNAHCAVEEEHAGCATDAIVAFTSTDDPLVTCGVRDHEDDLAGFYDDCTELIRKETLA